MKATSGGELCLGAGDPARASALAPGLFPQGLFPARVLAHALGVLPLPRLPGRSVQCTATLPTTLPPAFPCLFTPRWHRYWQRVCACSRRSLPGVYLNVQMPCPGSGFGCCSPVSGCQGPSAPAQDVWLRTRRWRGLSPAHMLWSPGA